MKYEFRRKSGNEAHTQITIGKLVSEGTSQKLGWNAVATQRWAEYFADLGLLSKR